MGVVVRKINQAEDNLTNSNEYMNSYMKERYRQRRTLAFSIIGDRCVNCGSKDQLEIDHVEREGRPSGKKFSRFWNMSMDKFLEELDKCQPLCHDCHLLKSRDDLGVPHGGGVSGKRNCRCELCSRKKSEYMLRYR